LRKYWIFQKCLLISLALQYSTRGVLKRRAGELLVSIACIEPGGNLFHATRNIRTTAK